MSDLTAISPDRTLYRSIILRCRELGLASVLCTNDGSVIEGTIDGDAAAVDRFESSEIAGDLLQHQLRAAVDSGSEIDPWKATDDLWIVPLPIMERRRCTGYVVIIVPQSTVVVSAQSATSPDEQSDAAPLLRAEAQRDGSGDHAVGGEANQSRPEIPVAVRRIASTVRWWVDDLRLLDGRESELVSVGQQLCETYEELSLLYKIGRRMNVMQRPERFVNMVCRELFEVLSFRNIVVRLSRDTRVCDNMQDALMMEGTWECAPARASQLIEEIMERLSDGSTLVMERTSEVENGRFVELGESLIAHPIMIGREVIGAIVACEKRGRDTQISTVDMKMLDATASNLQIFLENASLYEQTQQMFLGTLEALTASIDAKDPYTCGHSQRVALLSRHIAQAATLSDQTVERIHIAGLVHDVGKIGVREDVLCKPGRLTNEEFAQIKRHPEIGARILKDIPNFDDIIPGVMHHHERYDGNGYPHGLEGARIPLFGRIIAIADSFDAMSSTRTYRTAMSRNEVLSEIRRCAGTQFDPELARAFLGMDLGFYYEMAASQQIDGVRSKGEAA